MTYKRKKVLLLLLAGAGILVALALIALGIYFWSRGRQLATVTTPTSTPTATPAIEQPTALPGVVVIVPTRTSTPTATPAGQMGDSFDLMATVTRAPTDTPTPIPPRPRTREVSVDGTLELIAPDDNIQIGDTVEFKWQWLADKGCEQPPEGYAFEIRVWRDNNSASPQGAMDARTQKQNITCDPTTGIRGLTIGRIKSVPGFENSTEGRFRWDVALVKLDPYTPVITTQYRTFFTN
jgi:hypothetical protein